MVLTFFMFQIKAVNDSINRGQETIIQAFQDLKSSIERRQPGKT